MILRVLTHTSGEFETNIETFDPVELNNQLNDADKNNVLLGNLNISRIDIKAVIPVEE
jgi:hypothetical protein